MINGRFKRQAISWLVPPAAAIRKPDIRILLILKFSLRYRLLSAEDFKSPLDRYDNRFRMWRYPRHVVSEITPIAPWHPSRLPGEIIIELLSGPMPASRITSWRHDWSSQDTSELTFGDSNNKTRALHASMERLQAARPRNGVGNHILHFHHFPALLYELIASRCGFGWKFTNSTIMGIQGKDIVW